MSAIIGESGIIKIGNQIWTKFNLATNHYRNGEIIPQVTDPSQWSSLTTGAWCWYNNDPNNKIPYGKLYNWYAMTDPRGIAPYGWHVPDAIEWTTLIDYSDGPSNAALNLKSKSNWFNDGNGINRDGFNYFGSGYRDGSTSVFYNLNSYSYCWIYHNLQIIAKRFDWNSSGISTSNINRNYGAVIRLIKD